MEVPPLTLPAIVSIVAATEIVTNAFDAGAPASAATSGVSAPVQSTDADVPSAADLEASRKAKKKEKKLRQKAGRQAQQQAGKVTNDKVNPGNLVLRYEGATCAIECSCRKGLAPSHPALPYALSCKVAANMHDCV